MIIILRQLLWQLFFNHIARVYLRQNNYRIALNYEICLLIGGLRSFYLTWPWWVFFIVDKISKGNQLIISYWVWSEYQLNSTWVRLYINRIVESIWIQFSKIRFYYTGLRNKLVNYINSLWLIYATYRYT